MKEATPAGCKPIFLYNVTANHATIELLKYLKDNGVITICFPSNSVGNFSPLENHFFHRFKTKFDQTSQSVLGQVQKMSETQSIITKMQAIQNDKNFLTGLVQESWRAVGFVRSKTNSNHFRFDGDLIRNSYDKNRNSTTTTAGKITLDQAGNVQAEIFDRNQAQVPTLTDMTSDWLQQGSSGINF